MDVSTEGQIISSETPHGTGEDGSDERIRHWLSLWLYRLGGAIWLIGMVVLAEPVVDPIRYPWVMQTWRETGGIVTSSVPEDDHLQVEYEYEVDGTLYSSHCGAYGCEPLDENRGEQFDVGARVTVHFDPSSPDAAFLAYPAPSFWDYMSSLFWLVMGWLGMGLMLVRIGDPINEPAWRIWGRRFEELKGWISDRHRTDG